ncbi:MAG: hypothetical protein U0X76_04700 [Bacteroidia bacterium]
MNNESRPLYEEKQYLGYNQLSMLRRLSLALFCFTVYWWKTTNHKDGAIFFALGMIIILISILLLFVLHLKIRVYKTHIEFDGLWTSRKVRLELKDIVKVERRKYSSYHLNNAVFNLHFKGKVRFYTGGSEAVEITDKSGTPYRIGTQRPVELEKVLRELTA